MYLLLFAFRLSRFALAPLFKRREAGALRNCELLLAREISLNVESEVSSCPCCIPKAISAVLDMRLAPSSVARRF